MLCICLEIPFCVRLRFIHLEWGILQTPFPAPGPVVCAALLPTFGGLATLMPAQREPHKHTGSNRGAASLASFILES